MTSYTAPSYGRSRDSGVHGHIVLSVQQGRNARVLRETLEAESLVCIDAPTVEAVAGAIHSNAGLIVITEEVITDLDMAKQLSECLDNQPDWSDIPVIILMRECKRFADALGLFGETHYRRGVLLLELPLKRPVFLSMVRTCLLNRQRQYVLRDTLHQLEESNRTLESFSYTAAHELRNPLGVVTSSFDLLARMKLDDKPQKIVDMGQRTAQNMNRMLSVLLDYGKVRSQSADTFVPVDMNTVIKEAILNLQPLIQASAAKVTWPDLPLVQGNRQLLVQLASNLVKNAIVHNDSGSPQVAISVEEPPIPHSQVARWLFLVSDNGPGISPEAQEEIFILFNRAGKSRGEGSGIGLALCRRVVEQHQGEIGVQSVVGEGSTFYFDLPKAVVESPKTGG